MEGFGGTDADVGSGEAFGCDAADFGDTEEEDEGQQATEVSEDGGRRGGDGDEKPVRIKPVYDGSGSNCGERQVGEGAEGGPV